MSTECEERGRGGTSTFSHVPLMVGMADTLDGRGPPPMRLRDLGFIFVVAGAAMATGRGAIRPSPPPPRVEALARPEVSARVDEAFRAACRPAPGQLKVVLDLA